MILISTHGDYSIYMVEDECNPSVVFFSVSGPFTPDVNRFGSEDTARGYILSRINNSDI